MASGTHRELMTARGLYAELFTLQARAYHQPGPSPSPPSVACALAASPA